MSRPESSSSPQLSPYLVAAAGWALPGLGYGLIGERARGLTVGITIACLFVAGLLVGGVRSLEVPLVDHEGGRLPANRLLDEVRSKPWSIAQVMVGPIAMGGAYFSAWAGPHPGGPGSQKAPAAGVESHARVNEIAVLYTAVAGMLNLLAVIDSAHRAGRQLEEK